MFFFRVSVSAVAICFIAAATECGATDWIVPTGNWSDGYNWSDGEPVYDTHMGTQSVARIDNGGTATIDQDGEGCYQLRVGTETGSGMVEMNDGTLHAAATGSCLAEGGGQWIGHNGVGVFRQTGGTNVIDDKFPRPYIPSLSIGLATTGDSADGIGEGSYELDTSANLTAQFEGVGCNFSMSGSATGCFNHTGGTNACTILGVGIAHYGATSNGTYNLSGSGELSASREFIGAGGIGTFNQSGGTNIVTGELVLSFPSDPHNYPWLNVYGVGQYNLNGGQLSTETETLRGRFTHTGGSNTCTGNISIGDIYELSGTGELRAADEIVGGTLTQTGGTNIITYSLSIRNWRTAYPSEPASYSLTGGTLLVEKGTSSAKITVGSASPSDIGIINLGNANGTSSIAETGSGYGGDLEVWNWTSLPLERNYFQGWGVVGLTGTLTNNGRIVARGYGTDRELVLSSFTYVANTQDWSSRGWFAEDHGKLMLPSVSVAAGDGTYNWGESADDTTIDLVNSVRMLFTDVTTGGEFSIDLLASDRGDVSLLSEVTFIGVWDFRPPEGLTFTTVDLTFRYDDVLAGELGINENALHLYHFTGGEWVDVTSGIDAANNWIFAADMNSFSLFAVGGVPVPEPSSIILLSLSAMVGAIQIARRRRQRGDPKKL